MLSSWDGVIACRRAPPRLSLESTVELRSGLRMPLFGLGTWLATSGGECKEAVQAALQYGYRLIDTATMYNNHEDVRAALQEWDAAAPRPFIVSKLSPQPQCHGKTEPLVELDRTLEELGLEQLDLWLMHSPSPGKVVDTWRAMLSARDAGKVRAVGVSNFGPEQIEGLKAAGCEAPEVNQFELHCWNQQRELVAYCEREGIVVMSFCPLARCKMFGQTALAELAAQTDRTEAALALRWLLQKGYVTIPKSSNAERIVSNAVFGWELSDAQMAQIDLLEQKFLASNACKAQELLWSDVQ